jgi:hypothetical protein
MGQNVEIQVLLRIRYVKTVLEWAYLLKRKAKRAKSAASLSTSNWALLNRLIRIFPLSAAAIYLVDTGIAFVQQIKQLFYRGI